MKGTPQVLYPPETFWRATQRLLEPWFRGARVRWSLLAVLAHLEFFYEFWEMCGFLCYLQHGRGASCASAFWRQAKTLPHEYRAAQPHLKGCHCFRKT